MSTIALVQARVLTPSMFMAQEPHTPSRQERRKVSVVSISFLILISASRTIGPQSLRSISKVSMSGFFPSSGFQRYTLNARTRVAPGGPGTVFPIPIFADIPRIPGRCGAKVVPLGFFGKGKIALHVGEDPVE